MEEILLRACVGFFFCLSMRPSFNLAWTSRKCVVYEDPNDIHEPIYCASFNAFPDRTLAANCVNIASLQQDVSDLPGDVLALCVSGSAQIIPKNAFFRFQKLVYLALRIPVKSILPGAFNGLPNLQNLSIIFTPGTVACNNISLAQDVFLGLLSLRTLILQVFCVVHIENMFLPLSIQLQELSLQRDNIEDMSLVFNVFRGIQSVHRLDLRYNNIEIINFMNSHPELSQFQQWGKMTNIFELDLSGNPLKTIKPDTFSGLGLHSLILNPAPLMLNDLFNSGIITLNHMFLGFIQREAPDIIKTCCSMASKFTFTSFILTDSAIQHISGEALIDCWSLESFDLSYNDLTYIESDILYRIPHLRMLALSNNHLKLDLCPPLYEDIHFSSGLQVFLFSVNSVSVIKSKQFACMPQLQELDLSQNNIESIEPLGFFGLSQLKSLTLCNNKLKQLTSQTVANVPNLVILDIGNTGIVKINETEFGKLKFLEELKLNTRQINFIPENFPQLKHLTVEVDTDIVIIGKTMASMSAVQIMTLSANNILFCYDKVIFQNVRELSIYNRGVISFCEKNATFFKMFPILEKLFYSQDYGRESLYKYNFSNLYYLKTLEVVDVILTMEGLGSNPEYIFQNLLSLEILKLTNSGLKYLTSSMFNSMRSLKVFDMYGNDIATLENDIQVSFLNLKYLYLYGVTFQCDCVNDWLITWVATTPNTFVTNLNNVICFKQHTMHNFLTFLEKSCDPNIEFVLFLVTYILLVIFISVTLLYNTCSYYFLSLMYIFLALLHRLRGRRGGHVEYDYDAFVSYCSLDQDWILQHLIPNLEEKGPPFLKLCLHNRDFEVGKDIVDNIVDSIYRSRKTICVISHNYLRSDWCSLEMRMATYRLLAEHEDVLVLVFLEHISRYKLSSYHRLAKMVKKKTYIDWAKEDMNKQVVFWERLRRAIEKENNEYNDADTL